MYDGRREIVSLRRRGKSVRGSKLAWVGIAVAAVLAGVVIENGRMRPAHANEAAVAARAHNFAIEARVSETVSPARASEFSATQLSPECAARPPAYEGRRAFRRIRQAMNDRRAARVLAIGSSSIVGVGASTPAATFTEQLETDLERVFKGADFDVIGRGVSGEVAAITATRIRSEALQLKPDLIVWQVGTNDGVAKVDQAVFAALLTTTLRWLATYRYDVVLVDPQYVSKFATDEHYRAIVRIITEVARREHVPLVHRYEAMEDLARRQINRSYMASDLFHLNDLGYKCMAEFAAQAIEVGIKQAVLEGTPGAD